MKIYLFNPEHDMALASYSPFYKSPAEIVRMKDNLAALPAWYASVGDVVCVQSDLYRNLFFTQCLGSGVVPYGRCVPEGTLASVLENEGGECDLCPWGWDPALVHEWEVRKMSGLLLPSALEVERMRVLSGRQQCVKVLDSFAYLEGVCGKAVVCTSLEEVKNFINSVPDVILKAPWSGSGRGLARTSLATWNANLEGWVARILRTQGSIMAEPIYNKVYDFAMEFYNLVTPSDSASGSSHSLSFVGYSLFETDTHGNYKQNVLVSNEGILARLTRFVSLQLLEEVKQQLLVVLSDLLDTDYEGYFGVDMMICEQDGKYLIHPCVEINLRMNMGVVARLLFDRYIVPEVCGEYVVEHFFNDGEALLHDAQLRKQYPAVVKAGKMAEGYFPLTPVEDNTRYQCYVLLGHSR